MDHFGIIGCSESEYFSYDSTSSNDRRSTGSFQSIFKLDDPNTTPCFTNISPVRILSYKSYINHLGNLRFP